MVVREKSQMVKGIGGEGVERTERVHHLKALMLMDKVRSYIWIRRHQ